MTLEQLSIRIEENNLGKIRVKVKNNEFKSISDFIRIAIEEKLKSFKTDFIIDGFVVKKRNNTNIKFI